MQRFERFLSGLMALICQGLTIDARDVTRRRDRDRAPSNPGDRPDAMEA